MPSFAKKAIQPECNTLGTLNTELIDFSVVMNMVFMLMTDVFFLPFLSYFFRPTFSYTKFTEESKSVLPPG